MKIRLYRRSMRLYESKRASKPRFWLAANVVDTFQQQRKPSFTDKRRLSFVRKAAKRVFLTDEPETRKRRSETERGAAPSNYFPAFRAIWTLEIDDRASRRAFSFDKFDNIIDTTRRLSRQKKETRDSVVCGACVRVTRKLDPLSLARRVR